MQSNYNNIHCIVTGGAGFIGQHLVTALIERGAHVHVIENFSYGATRSSIHPKAHIYESDVTRYKSFATLPSVDYRYLFHFAAPSSVVLFNTNPQRCTQETVLGFLRAMEFCSQRSIKCIFPSSGSLYAGTQAPQKEESLLNLNSINAYARSKYSLEQIQAAYSTAVDSLALRIFAGYGPGEQHKGDTASIAYLFSKAIFKNERPILYGNGQQRRDFIYISDLINAILTLAQHCEEQIINIGSGKNISLVDLITRINQVAGKTLQPIIVEKPNLYLEETLADTSRAKKYLKQPIISIEQGIERVLQSLSKK